MLFFLWLHTYCIAQPAEVRWLRTINHNETHSDQAWLFVSSTAAPAGIAVPFFTALNAHANGNKNGLQHALCIGLSQGVSSLFSYLLKKTIDRNRPYDAWPAIVKKDDDVTSSFPSGHTTLAFATAMSLTLHTRNWKIALPAFGWAVGVGYSRMYLGMHYPSDVMAGAALGCLSAWGVHWLHNRWKKRTTDKTSTIH